MSTHTADERLGMPLVPDPVATVYVFGVKRRQDAVPWYLAFTDQGLAENYPCRCTAVCAVLLYAEGS